MKSLFKNSIIFLVFFLIISELLVRIFHLTTDAPRLYQNESGNLRYYPNQSGYWDGGSHQWYINKLGYPGRSLPKSYDNLITIIGDSYIQNFMNPDSCRQSNFLQKVNNKYNYLELARDGSNILDYFEFVKDVDSLKPIVNLIYINTRDFKQSIKEGEHANGRQIDLNTNKIEYSRYKESKIKNALYNFKFFYYLYRENISLFTVNKKENTNQNKNDLTERDKEDISKLLQFLKREYADYNIVFICHTDIHKFIIDEIKRKDFKYLALKEPKNKIYRFNGNGHWNCFGHEFMAQQVGDYLQKSFISLEN